MKAQRIIARVSASLVAMTMFFTSAASAESITVQTDRLNMRKEASASSKAVGIVEKHDTLSFIAEDGEWYQVKDGTKIGFVMKDYVSMDESKLAEDVAANTQAVSLKGRTTARINMRALPITSADIVKVVPDKTEVEIIGQCGVWYQVKYSGKTGYLMAQYLTVEGESTQAPAQPSAPEASAPEASSDTIYSTAKNGKTTTRVNMRKSPSTSASVVDVVDKNDAVTILGENGSWYLISANGEVGYLSKSYVQLTTSVVAPTQPSTPSTSTENIYSTAKSGKSTERVNMRKSPSTSASVLTVLSKNQTVSVLGESGDWYKVSYSGKTGYVSRSYITLTESSSSVQTPSQNSGLTVYATARAGKATDRVNLREAASTSADVLKVVSKNASVTVLGEQGDFYQVSYSGKTGFISKNYVTLTEAPSEEKPEEKPVETPDNSTSSAQDTIYSKAKEGMTTVKVNMRREPEGDVLYTLAADTTLVIIGERGNWYLVSWMSTTGYVSKSYVTENISAPSQPDNSTTVKPEESQPDTSKGTTAYITGSVNMRKGAGTSYGIIKVLTRGTEITFYSLTDGWYYVKAGDTEGYVSSKYVTTDKIETPAPSQPSAPESVSGKVQQADWWTSDIQKVFARGVVATVTDVDTGISWQVKRSGGSNHADVQPLTAADTAKMKQAYGGTWSWNRRAIWVTINGVTYAASMNGMPHGTGSITTNNFDGHHCIHFLNSRTHTENRWDTQHQAMVQKAYKAGQ